MRSSFNALGSARSVGGAGIPVWLGTVRPVPVGGTLAASYLLPGALYPAGTPVNLDGKVITPFVVMKVTAVSSGVATVDPGPYGIAPSTSHYVCKVGATFAKNGTAAAITAVAANASDPSKWDITTTLTLAAGDVIALAPDSADPKAPNAYLYNDIWLGDIDVTAEGAGATGAAVVSHPEGILIERTPAADVKAQMLAAVPQVLQVGE